MDLYTILKLSSQIFHEQLFHVVFSLLVINFHSTAWALHFKDIQIDLCATYLVGLAFEELTKLILLHFDVGSVDATHILDVEVPGLSQIAQYQHSELSREVDNIWMICKVSIREDLEELKEGLRDHPFAGASGATSAKSILVDDPAVLSADSKVISSKDNIIWGCSVILDVLSTYEQVTFPLRPQGAHHSSRRHNILFHRGLQRVKIITLALIDYLEESSTRIAWILSRTSGIILS